MLPFAYKLLALGTGGAIAWWQYGLAKEHIKEEKELGEGFTFNELYHNPHIVYAAEGISIGLWYATGAFWGADVAFTGYMAKALPFSSFLTYSALAVPAGLSGIILGAAAGIGISKAIWGPSGEQTARDFYSGKVSPSEWWGAVKTIPSNV